MRQTRRAIADWSGFYIGANAGYGLGTDPFNQTDSVAGTVASVSSINSRVTPQGGLFGGQLGYNVQAGHLVFGAEGDLQWADQHDTAGCGQTCLNEPSVSFAGTDGSAEQRIKWFGTARGRFGWANDGWLFYVTGGAAWAGIDATTAFSETFGAAALARTNTTSFTKSGAVIGGGAELQVAGPWTAKVEYLFIDFGSISDTLNLTRVAPETLTTDSAIHDHIIRVGLNYKFNWGGPLSTRD